MVYVREASIKAGGYGHATAGAVVGGCILGALGALIGYQIGAAIPYEPSSGGGFISDFDLHLEPVIGGFTGFATGLWIGQIVGCWLVLRWRGFDSAGPTAWTLGTVLLVIVPVWVYAVSDLTNSLYAGLLSSLILLIGLPSVSRWLTYRLEDVA